jgi:hypothetical protein
VQRAVVRGLPAHFLLGVVVMFASIRHASAELDLSRPSIPPGRILSGGPPKDGIPALVDPTFVTAAAASYLRDTDRVIGIHDGQMAKAYPLRLLNWHEVVNDRIGDQAIVVTYCPLTASAVVFDRRIEGEALTFGVSGRLYESNVLFYDRETESLWSQLTGQGVTGEQNGRTLTQVPAIETSWSRWRAEHPETLVLSLATGHRRDYEHNPYAEYDASPATMFPTSGNDTRLFIKDRVLGVVIDGTARAYPLRRLAESGEPIEERVADVMLRIRFDPVTHTAEALADGQPYPATVAYWFAWSSFHPDTEVWGGSKKQAAAPDRAGDVEIVLAKGYWSNLLGVVGDGGGGAAPTAGSIYVITGTLDNVSQRTIHHVELEFTLLDADGAVVHRQVGMNRAAESLRPPPMATRGTPATTPREVTPIEPGGRDTFRMLLFGDELPGFTDMRVAVVAVE